MSQIKVKNPAYGNTAIVVGDTDVKNKLNTKKLKIKINEQEKSLPLTKLRAPNEYSYSNPKLIIKIGDQKWVPAKSDWYPISVVIERSAKIAKYDSTWMDRWYGYNSGYYYNLTGKIYQGRYVDVSGNTQYINVSSSELNYNTVDLRLGYYSSDGDKIYYRDTQLNLNSTYIDLYYLRTNTGYWTHSGTEVITGKLLGHNSYAKWNDLIINIIPSNWQWDVNEPWADAAED